MRQLSASYMRFLFSLLAVALFNTPALTFDTNDPRPSCLVPSQHRNFQVVSFSSPRLYCVDLGALRAEGGGTFEIKVSVPASTPCRLRLAMRESFEPAVDTSDALGLPDPTTALESSFAFDEKITFKVYPNGRVVRRSSSAPLQNQSGSFPATETPAAALWFEIAADPQSVAHSLQRTGVTLNLVMDRVAFGLLPHRAFHLAPAALITIAFTGVVSWALLRVAVPLFGASRPPPKAAQD